MFVFLKNKKKIVNGIKLALIHYKLNLIKKMNNLLENKRIDDIEKTKKKQHN